MAIPTLTEEQIRTWTREQKDTWWLTNVFRGDMPQLTLRAAVTGFVLGGALSATNLYVGAKTGWTLGVGLTSVILAFSMFFVIGKLQDLGGWKARAFLLIALLPFGALMGWVASEPITTLTGAAPSALTGWIGVAVGAAIAILASIIIIPRRKPLEFTILENNASQSIATAAGYMTGPLISGMAAYMWIQNEPMPWYQMLGFNVVLSVLGVLVAFPMKRRFINDEQQPFPEGRACGVVLDTLYTSAAAVGLFKAKALAFSALLAGSLTFIMGEAYLKAIRSVFTWFGSGKPWSTHLTDNKDSLNETWHLPHNADPLYNWLATKGTEPHLAGVPIRQLGLTPALDLAMIGAGGLMGIKAACNMMLGMLLNFVVIVPWMIAIGEIKPRTGSFATGDAVFTRTHIVNTWSLWWGISIMVVASMVALFAKPKIFIEAFNLFKKRDKAAAADPLKDIEFPLWISWVGIPIVGAVGVWLAHTWFGVPILEGAMSIPLIIVLTLIAASSTALTGITPTGSLSKIPQFIFGYRHPQHPPTNLMTAVMCVEVSSNASNLLMDIKPGYMLGAKPRQQAIGHTIGILAGAIASTPLFHALFLSRYSPADAQAAAAANVVANQTAQADALAAGTQAVTIPNTYMQDAMVTEQFGFPSALQWKGVSDLMQSLFGGPTAANLLTNSIIISMVIAAVVGLVFEIIRTVTKNKFPLSPLAIGLGVVVPPESTLAMFVGALFFWAMHKLYHNRKESTGNLLWIQTHEPICAGIIAGAALVGIGDVLVRVFALAPLG